MDLMNDRAAQMRMSPVEDESKLTDYLIRRFREMIDERKPWDHTWQVLIRRVLPERVTLHDNYHEKAGHTPAEEDIENMAASIFNSEAPDAIHILAAGMESYAVTRMSPWFAHSVSRGKTLQRPGVSTYLSDLDDQLHHALSISNFYSEFPRAIMDCAAFGSCCMFMEHVGMGYRFLAIDPRQIYVAEDVLRRVDTVYRTFSMTKRQLIQRFGLDRLSNRIKRIEDDAKKVNVLHAVFPRNDAQDQEAGLERRAPRSLLTKNMPYISVYMELPGPVGDWSARDTDDEKILWIGGYREMPYSYWRWSTTSDWPYGVSPSMRMLPQILQANVMSQTLLNAAELHIRPPWMVPSSVRSLRLEPGGVSYLTNPQERIEAVTRAGGEYPIGTDREERIAQSIRSGYGIDFLLAFSGRMDHNIRTAEQVYQIEAQSSAVLNAMFGHMGDELLAPTVRWVALSEDEENRLPEWPQALEEEMAVVGPGLMSLRYPSPLGLALRRQAEVVTPMRALQSVMPLAQVSQELFMTVDLPGAFRRMLLAGGWNPADMKTDEEYAAALRGAAQDAAEERNAALAESKAKALRNSGVDPNSADPAAQLQRIIQGIN